MDTRKEKYKLEISKGWHLTTQSLPQRKSNEKYRAVIGESAPRIDLRGFIEMPKRFIVHYEPEEKIFYRIRTGVGKIEPVEIAFWTYIQEEAP